MQRVLAFVLQGLLVLTSSAAALAGDPPDRMTGSISGSDWIYPLSRSETLENVAYNYLLSSRNWVQLIPYNRFDSGFDLPSGTSVRIPLAWLRPTTGEALVRSAGRVWIYSKGNRTRKAIEHITVLNVGERIHVETGSASVHFPDGSDMVLGPSTDIEITRLTTYGRSGMNDTRLRLRKGRVKLEVRERNGPEGRFEVQTRDVVAAVRGTTFTLEQNTTGTRIEVHDGIVALKNRQSSVGIRAGSGAETDSNGIRQRSLPSIRNLVLQDAGADQSISSLTASWTATSESTRTQYVVKPFAASEEAVTVLSRGVATGSSLQLPDTGDGRYTLLLQAIDHDNFHGRIQRFDYVVDASAPRQRILQIDGGARP